jgi:hypothetical protein
MEKFYCALHGSNTNNGSCCPRAYAVKLPERTMFSIPWATRVDARHKLQEIHSRCLEIRASLVVPDLDADGAIEDIDRIIDDLQGIRRRLS